MYAIAKREKLTEILQDLKIALRACGHRLRMHRCEVWFPGWADVPDDDPHARSAGWSCWVRQPQGDWCAAIGQVLGARQDRLTTQLPKRQSSVQALIPPVHGKPLQKEARSMDDANESGDARVGPRREAHSERHDDGTHREDARAVGRGERGPHGQQLGCFGRLGALW